MTNSWKLGLSLALLTCFFWATLPIALKVALEALDPMTLTWVRFTIASVFTAAWIAARGGFAAFRGLSGAQWLLLLVAALGLLGNYVMYLLGLKYTTPANAQLLIQSAPLLLALSGVLLFGERMNRWQGLGFAAIAGGLLLFFLEQRGQVSGGGSYNFGALLILLAAISWVGYALIQKKFAERLSSQQILLVMYVTSSVALLAWAKPSSIAQIDATHWWAVGYCAFNTIAAYAAFAEAMVLWEASRVSAILSMTPILTVLAMSILAPLFPQHLQPEQIQLLGWCGGVLVVLGSMMASLAKSKIQAVTRAGAE